MGKILLIAVFIIIAIFAAITITIQRHSSKVPEMLSENLAEQQAANLAAYALGYGINKFLDGNVTFYDSITGYIDDFTPLEVLDGSIDSIKFTNESDGSIRINSYVTYNINDETVNHQSSAVVFSSEPSDCIPNAIGAGGSITVGGNAKVTGDTLGHADIDFEEIFGMTKEEMKAAATNTYDGPINDPTPVDSITWIEGDVHFTSGVTGMSGLLIVTGYCKWSGADFDGILYVMGELVQDIQITGDSVINGAIIVEGDADVTGNTTINYDAGIVNDVFDNYLPPICSEESHFKILEWKE